MNELMNSDAKEIILKISELLNTSFDKSYSIISRQGDVLLIKYTLIVIGAIVTFNIFMDLLSKINAAKADKEEIPLFIAIIFMAAISVSFVIGAAIGAAEAIQVLFNREYWVIEQILKMTQGGK